MQQDCAIEQMSAGLFHFLQVGNVFAIGGKGKWNCAVQDKSRDAAKCCNKKQDLEAVLNQVIKFSEFLTVGFSKQNNGFSNY